MQNLWLSLNWYSYEQKLVIKLNTYLLQYKYPYCSTKPSSSTSNDWFANLSSCYSILETNNLNSNEMSFPLPLFSYTLSFPTFSSPYSVEPAVSFTACRVDPSSEMKIIAWFTILAIYTSKSSFRRRILLYISVKASTNLPTLPCELNADCELLKLDCEVMIGSLDLMLLNFCCDNIEPGDSIEACVMSRLSIFPTLRSWSEYLLMWAVLAF